MIEKILLKSETHGAIKHPSETGVIEIKKDMPLFDFQRNIEDYSIK